MTVLFLRFCTLFGILRHFLMFLVQKLFVLFVFFGIFGQPVIKCTLKLDLNPSTGAVRKDGSYSYARREDRKENRRGVCSLRCVVRHSGHMNPRQVRWPE